MKSTACWGAVCCALMVAPLSSAKAQLLYSLTDLNLDLSQVDFTYASASQSYSTYGLLSANASSVLAASGGALSSGYVNIYNPSPDHVTSDPWLVRNMPVDSLYGILGPEHDVRSGEQPWRSGLGARSGRHAFRPTAVGAPGGAG